jgi:hypothetical protein
MVKLPFLRKTDPGVPLLVSMTGVRLGDKVVFAGSDPELLLPAAAKVGLSGQTLVVSPDGEALRRRAEREGVLVEVAEAPPPGGTFDLAIAQAEGAWTDGLSALAAAVRPGGRIVVISRRQAQGLLSRFGKASAGPDGPDSATVILELVRAGWTRGRSVGERDGLRFVEAVRS